MSTRLVEQFGGHNELDYCLRQEIFNVLKANNNFSNGEHFSFRQNYHTTSSNPLRRTRDYERWLNIDKWDGYFHVACCSKCGRGPVAIWDNELKLFCINTNHPPLIVKKLERMAYDRLPHGSKVALKPLDSNVIKTYHFQ